MKKYLQYIKEQQEEDSFDDAANEIIEKITKFSSKLKSGFEYINKINNRSDFEVKQEPKEKETKKSTEGKGKVYYYQGKYYTEDKKDITEEYKKNPEKWNVIKINKLKKAEA